MIISKMSMNLNELRIITTKPVKITTKPVIICKEFLINLNSTFSYFYNPDLNDELDLMSVLRIQSIVTRTPVLV